MRGASPNAQRRRFDDYFTPLELALAITQRLHGLAPRPTVILEPACGGGAFVEAALTTWGELDVVVDDAQSTCRDLCRDLWAADSLREGRAADYFEKISLAVTNPPFLLAERFAREMLECVRVGGHVALLLRLSFFGAAERLPFWRGPGACLRWWMPITPRPSFTNDGRTDASEYGLFVWRRGYRGLPQCLPHIEWRKDKRRLSGVALLAPAPNRHAAKAEERAA